MQDFFREEYRLDYLTAGPIPQVALLNGITSTQSIYLLNCISVGQEGVKFSSSQSLKVTLTRSQTPTQTHTHAHIISLFEFLLLVLLHLVAGESGCRTLMANSGRRRGRQRSRTVPRGDGEHSVRDAGDWNRPLHGRGRDLSASPHAAPPRQVPRLDGRPPEGLRGLVSSSPRISHIHVTMPHTCGFRVRELLHVEHIQIVAYVEYYSTCSQTCDRLSSVPP